MSCDHPDCSHAAQHVYSDREGNEIELCADHYFRAVYPGGLVEKVEARRRDDGDDGSVLGDINDFFAPRESGRRR